jgi:acyl carrier protein
MNQDIFKTVKALVIENLEIEDPDKVVPEASFANDLGADSLDTVELVMALEESFDIEIPDEVAEQIDTVGKAVDHIAEATGAATK